MIVSLALLAYSPVLRDGFVFDDVSQARDLIPAGGFTQWLESSAAPWWPPEKSKTVWRPLTRLTILAEKAIAGQGTAGQPLPSELAAWPFHLISLVLHAAASLLVLILARDLGLRWPSAAVAASILAVHPIRSEAVHQIVGQSEILAAIFMTGGLSLYVRARIAGRPWPRIAAVQAIAYGLALCSKEHAVLYPGFLLLLEWRWRRAEAQQSYRSGGSSITNAGSASIGAKPPAPAKSMLPVGVVLGLVLGLYLWGRVAVTGGLVEDPTSVPRYENVMAGLSFGERLPAALGVFAYAWSKALLPIGLSPDYSAASLALDSGWSWPMSYAGVVVLGLLVSIAAVSYRRNGSAWTLILAGLLAYALISNAFFTIGVAVAERLWYFPLIALALGAGAGWERWVEGRVARSNRRRNISRPAWLAFALAVVLLLGATWSYAPAWRTPLSHALRTAQRFPRSWRANHNLAREYNLASQFEKGLEAGRAAADLRPDDARSWYVLALNAMNLDGKTEVAQEALRKSIELDPGLHRAFKLLGDLLILSGRPREALPYLQRYLEWATDDAGAVQASIEAIKENS